jgi:hypothetical protein
MRMREKIEPIVKINCVKEEKSMKRTNAFFLLVVMCSLTCASLVAQSAAAPVPAVRAGEPAVAARTDGAVTNNPGGIGPGVKVPRLIKLSGSLKTPTGDWLTGVHGLTLALYKEQQGGSPVWLESQNVELDEQGRYAVLLGATKSEGVPVDLFTADEPRWLGVQVQLPGYREEARVLLVSVPYALRAADAETLGGKPLSAFVQTDQAAAGTVSSGVGASAVTESGGPRKAATTSGTPGTLALFAGDSVSLSSSVATQSNGYIGIGTTSPSSLFHVNNGDFTLSQTGTWPVVFDQSPISTFTITNGGAQRLALDGSGNLGVGITTPSDLLHVNNGRIRITRTGTWPVLLDQSAGSTFTITNGGSARFAINGSGNVGIGTSSPNYLLDVAGNINSSSTVSASSFSGSGASLTNIPAGNLTGSISNSATTANTSNVANAIVLRDGSGNFSANTITANSFSGSGSALSNVNATLLNSVSTYARTDQANSLTGTQAVNGALSVRNGSYEQLSVDQSGNLVTIGSLSAGAGNFVTASGNDLLVGQATNGSSISNVFRVDSTGKGYFNNGTQTSGADFAESFAVLGDHRDYEPGDVLVIDPSGTRRMTLASSAYSTLVSGIYSTKPGVLATPYDIDHNGNVAKEVPLAVVGVVPCKVSAENGAIAVGDLLVTSATPGHAMRGSDRSRMLGAVVGKALEALSSGKGVIQVLVTLQ